MAHQYSVEIHNYLTDRLNDAKEKLKEAAISGADDAVKKAAGRIEALNRLRTMMTEKFDLTNRKYFHK